MFKLLESFIAVYETRNFSKAAAELFLSQPTISVRISRLESQLDTTLFDRKGRTEIQATENAKRFYPTALKILADWRAAQSTIADHQQTKWPFKIAASHTTATTLLPTIVRGLIPYIAQLQLEISLHNSDDILAMLAEHQADLGLIEKPSIQDGVSRYEIARDQLVLAGNLKSPIWLLREQGSGVLHYTQQYLRAKNIVPEQIVRVKSNTMIAALLAEGLGQSIISKDTLIPDTPFVDIGEDFHRSLYLLTPEHAQNSENAVIIAQLLQAIQDHKSL
ncbi:LysR family transcriptional regulator [Oenococcus kitaharae]|uniref:LysR family transcriptional regulator n=1 Tax=Oenococcus kitaharae DSM 17330 TaxID=1045004 RepID=G9WHA2_9LACO|nr:LysR family transcriptional regulator [Oenococcus kitaharae]EHN59668.1 LysR family transcriptional regulator [Oenococcus kitaharae DSM 17330]OEY83507.1 transcriptional regulator [Oenococcus kitaharae]OEY85306.1 transcriptional regulator [Oenococcus kitaharae]OEY86160.1 transcriptional regulator [Oenococcus kitaharae]